jgi:hypothetical protein
MSRKKMPCALFLFSILPKFLESHQASVSYWLFWHAELVFFLLLLKRDQNFVFSIWTRNNVMSSQSSSRTPGMEKTLCLAEHRKCQSSFKKQDNITIILSLHIYRIFWHTTDYYQSEAPLYSHIYDIRSRDLQFTYTQWTTSLKSIYTSKSVTKAKRTYTLTSGRHTFSPVICNDWYQEVTIL